MKAFPRADGKYNSAVEDEQGMDLRDWFAGLAMQAIIGREDNRFTTTLEFVGGKAYQYADAMMKAREQ
jgi:hypothetical protein